ncbi:hypothetical protein [Aeromonas salmonicida]|uniref:hypothetical protein n=1 Tax=Aeromonas salmonicida TaxID=645 RepID=UPI0035A658C0
MDLHTKAATYALISKKYLTRYVLTYDVLPLDLCYEVNGNRFFGSEILNNLLVQTKISDKEVVLELKEESCTSYVPISDLLSLGFTTQMSLDLFKERSYENFDVGLLNCRVIEAPRGTSGSDIYITPPVQIDKFDFSKKMALGDAVTALVHNQLLQGGWPNETTERGLFYKDEVIGFLLGTAAAEPAKKEIAASFFILCARYNIDKGWPTGEILDTIDRTSSTTIRQIPEFDIWLSTSRKLLNNEERHIKFSDDGDIILRAMMLVLLNPEQRNLEAMKESIGNNVYRLAEKFILARTGYSYLCSEERVKIGEARTFLQKFNARFHNPVEELLAQSDEWHEEFSPAKGLQTETGTGSRGMVLHQYAWLTFGEENEHGKVIKINGIKPYAGYSLDLVHHETLGLLLRIIDESGMDKYKGKFIQELIDVQKDLPEALRFEKYEHGLYLTLPALWLDTEGLKDKLEHIFTILRPLGLEQKKSAIG